MTITQLEYVVAVATYKSFVAAAEKCFVTQPTLSMQIQKLEDELGVKLFDRNKHPIAITAMGEAIVDQARIILADCDKIYELIQSQQTTISGAFKLAVIPTIAPYLLPGLLESYNKAYPEVKLLVKEMETDQILMALRNNEIDAGLLSTPLNENGIKEYPLFTEPLVGYFAAGEPALKKRMITPDDVELDRIWLLNEGHCLRNQVLDLCGDHIEKLQKERPYRYESSNVETLRKMVDTNKGLTILPEFATFEFSDDRMERVRYFEDPEPVREISMVTSGHFVKLTLLQSVIDSILKLVPEKMRVQKSNRKVLRIQSSKL
ncbi:MAG: hydrogen peroxide-inducible genes activator [Chitinophagaceae bacterium]|nr:hydrogen peroxide-inducible genes activator [Chitinophagaceae bacterium]MCB9047116.1 hydrogen peroxide-inducible genes activator [Chitinophagales bacterium]